ncbi:hypothetical protein ACINKY_08160 [Paenibacillus illinoisensis]|uniref:GNAT family N-acetyltransferase n=1 Tax=Paenibacillus illinoisensis TaxID=59845 RepID=A0ABW8HR99_9BACL
MLHIREATINDAEGIAKVHVHSWRTTYKGIIPEEFLTNLSYKQETNYGLKISEEQTIL